MSVRPAWLVYIAVFSPVGAKQRDPDSDVFNFPIYSSSGAGLGAVCVQSLQHRPLSQSSASTGCPRGGVRVGRLGGEHLYLLVRLTSSKTE